MNRLGFLRIAAVSPVTHVADPAANAREILALLAEHQDADVVLFPELCLTSYTCEDLFHQETLLSGGREQLLAMSHKTAGRKQLVVVGLPLAIDNGLYNCAAALCDGSVLGIVPKQYLAGYGEYYENRRFTPATGIEPPYVQLTDELSVPFGIDLLFFATDAGGRRVGVGIEICEDLWVPTPPSAFQALAGANVLLNLSASNELVGKRPYRKGLVESQSARCIAAYAYASSGPTESTTDLVFGGHCLIAENGHLLAQADALLGETADEESGHGSAAADVVRPLARKARPRGPVSVVADVDIEKLQHDRRSMTSFDDAAKLLPRKYRWLEFALEMRKPAELKREVPGNPFVPRDSADLDERCREIFAIQCNGLAKRVEKLAQPAPPNDKSQMPAAHRAAAELHIGISGGLDSTLALLVAVKTCDLLGWPRTCVHGLTMPGFGTTKRTLANAKAMMNHLGVTAEQIDIRPLCIEAFRELGHKPFGLDISKMDVESLQEALENLPPSKCHDLVFENVQARLRTFLLMSRGFVVGTGDMSEAALGWSTYNADHMSMYNPNFSVPKTLVEFLVRYVASMEFDGPARKTLLDICETTISPELLPPRKGEIVQSTEETLGSYELHDFFLFNMVRNGFSPAKILYLAGHADFREKHTPQEILAALRTFVTRFFANQFKRSCVPDAPKVGTVSLSPRGDWRMPSDAEANAWLAELDGLKTPKRVSERKRGQGTRSR